MCHSLVGRLFCTVVLGLLAIHGPAARAQTAAGIEQTFANSLTTIPTENLGVAGAFYVPAYSSVSMSQGKTRADFSVTLSIHNASETRPLVLKRIAYFDTVPLWNRIDPAMPRATDLGQAEPNRFAR